MFGRVRKPKSQPDPRLIATDACPDCLAAVGEEHGLSCEQVPFETFRAVGFGDNPTTADN